MITYRDDLAAAQARAEAAEAEAKRLRAWLNAEHAHVADDVSNMMLLQACVARHMTPEEVADAMLAIDRARRWKRIVCRIVGHATPFVVRTERREIRGCRRCGRFLRNERRA